MLKKKKEEKQRQVVEELFSNRDTAPLTEISIHKKSSKTSPMKWAMIVVTVAIVTGIGLVVATRGVGSIAMVAPKPTPTPTQVITPTPTAAPLPKKSDITIQVLNGGGVPGAATKMKKFLEDKGYKVTDVGNTDEYTYDKTTVVTKATKAASGTMVADDLKASYTVDTVATTLAETAAYDLQVIVGKQ